jgi:hypothetical protein
MLDAGFRFSCSFLRSVSCIITAAVRNASAGCEPQSWTGTLLRLMCLPDGSDLASSTAVMPHGALVLDAVHALLGIEEALPEDRPRRLDALLNLELGASLSRAGQRRLTGREHPALSVETAARLHYDGN